MGLWKTWTQDNFFSDFICTKELQLLKWIKSHLSFQFKRINEGYDKLNSMSMVALIQLLAYISLKEAYSCYNANYNL